MKAEYVISGDSLHYKMESDSLSYAEEAFAFAADFQSLLCDGRYRVRWKAIGKSGLSSLNVRDGRDLWTLLRIDTQIIAIPRNIEGDFIKIFRDAPAAFGDVFQNSLRSKMYELQFDFWVGQYLEQAGLRQLVVFSSRKKNFESNGWERWEMRALSLPPAICESVIYVSNGNDKDAKSLKYQSITKYSCQFY
ncbi:MAG: hypothetical protein EOO15_20885 [Chitinophagaceae bacterium]|nr:MAG: hypothetical protein EOO15_20885 [Chitinophagaceae bacterium]